MLTRRVRGRTFLLRPCPLLNQIIGYVLAVISQKYGVLIHAVCVMSNHWHVVLSDPHGRIVDFQRDCHSFITRAINAHHGEFEAMWSSEQSSLVDCEQPRDLLGKIAYTMANPTEAGLVRFGKSWPGLRMAWPRKKRSFARPPKFFRGPEVGGKWPATAVLELSRPPGYEDLSDHELATLVRQTIEAREQRTRDQYDAEGRKFLGRRAVLRQSRHSRPRTREPRFRISPKVAAKDKWRRIEALRRNQRFLAHYKRALHQWRAGDRQVLFPAGTYQMRVLHNVAIAAAPT